MTAVPGRRRTAARARAAARALRAFLAGFTGMPAARLEAPCAVSGGNAPCATCGGDARRAARDALAARAARRPSCC